MPSGCMGVKLRRKVRRPPGNISVFHFIGDILFHNNNNNNNNNCDISIKSFKPANIHRTVEAKTGLQLSMIPLRIENSMVRTPGKSLPVKC